MHRTYAAIALLLDVGTEPAPAPLPRNVRMLYGAHEVLVEMECIPGDSCSDEDVTTGGAVLDCVAQAIVWLARHGIVYIDLRGSNVIRRTADHTASCFSAFSDDAECPGVVEASINAAETAASPNACVTLVDVDDALLMPAPVTSIEGYDSWLAAQLKPTLSQQAILRDASLQYVRRS